MRPQAAPFVVPPLGGLSAPPPKGGTTNTNRVHFTPCIVFVTMRTLIRRSKVPTAAMSVRRRKKGTGGVVPQSSPSAPAAKLPKALVNIHTPIIIVANFAGASLDTIDRPTGDRHNSPIVTRM